jgi:hypothetical protein
VSIRICNPAFSDFLFVAYSLYRNPYDKIYFALQMLIPVAAGLQIRQDGITNPRQVRPGRVLARICNPCTLFASGILYGKYHFF